MGAMMWLHYTIETHLAFLIERVMTEVLSKSCCQVSANKELDLYSKVDIRCGDCDLQIKNYSFISSNESLQDRLHYYERFNPNLFFLFYKLHKDNILFAAIDDKPISSIRELSPFSVHSKTEFITYQDAADYIISKAAGADHKILLPQAEEKGGS